MQGACLPHCPSFQLPLYAGAVPPTLAGQIQEAGCEEALRAHEVDNKAALMPAASLLVRSESCPGFFARGLRTPWSETDLRRPRLASLARV